MITVLHQQPRAVCTRRLVPATMSADAPGTIKRMTVHLFNIVFRPWLSFHGINGMAHQGQSAKGVLYGKVPFCWLLIAPTSARLIYFDRG
jgi:hypothetical protein